MNDRDDAGRRDSALRRFRRRAGEVLETVAAVAEPALETTKEVASRGLETTREMASLSGRAVTSLYHGARKTITQEEAWEETERSVSELTEVARVQHAMILDLLGRVERLEAAVGHPVRQE